jgi:hypothetical protein
MKARDVIIGFIFLVLLIAGAIWIFRSRKTASTTLLPTSSPSFDSKLSTAFPSFKIPEGTERAELKDVSGGNNIGVATRSEVVVNLPEPPAGQTYKGYLVNDSGNEVAIGDFTTSKSGWMLSYDSAKFPGYNKVVVKVDSTPVLEGSF